MVVCVLEDFLAVGFFKVFEDHVGFCALQRDWLICCAI